MGKTSLALYLKEYAESKYNMRGFYVANDGTHELDSLIKKIVESVLNNIKNESCSYKIFNQLKEHVEEIGAFWTSIKFKPRDKEILGDIKDNFPEFLIDLNKILKDNNGIFLIIDDINGLTKSPEFANWYKSFAYTLAALYPNKSPFSILLVSYPEKFQALYEHNQSFTRIFKTRQIGLLSNIEVETFFKKTFNNVGMNLDDNALAMMVSFSSGMPNMMQEIGEGVFWAAEDDKIDEDDCILGIIRVGHEIGIKYLKPALDKSIRSNKYLTIFEKLGKYFLTNRNASNEYYFKKKDFMRELDDKQSKVFSDFLKRARDLKIIEFTGAPRSGGYTFTNHLYPVYFLIKALEKE